MSNQVDINPQAVLMIAEGLISNGGWIQGAEKDHQGVCIVGALRDAVGQVLRPQIESMCTEIPEFVALTADQQTRFVTDTVRRYDNGVINVFRQRFAQVFGAGTPIEYWNDMSGRKKQQVIEAMRATLEIVTQECLAAWEEKTPEQQGEELVCVAVAPVPHPLAHKG